ncbi:MAG: energy transducer TonB [Pseudomonadota bacterium]
MLTAPQDRVLTWAIAGSLLLHLVVLATLNLAPRRIAPSAPLTLRVQLLEAGQALRALPQARVRPMHRPPSMARQPMPVGATGNPAETAPAPTAQPGATLGPGPVASTPQAALATAPAPSAPAQTTAGPAPALTPPRFDAGYLNNPPPGYPALSRRLGEQGRVLLRVRVSEEGLAREVLVQEGSGFARLDQAAREAVLRWRFLPARQGGAAVEAWVLVPISFSLS